MKKTLLILALAVLGAQVVSAERKVRPRKAYNNFSYAMQELYEPSTGILIGEADWGAAFTKGRTYNLHKPIANFLVFGLDATWLDLNYAQYKTSKLGDGLHQADISIMGIGPSVNLYPVGKLGIHGYIRYNPTYATFFNEDFSTALGGYSSVMVSGGSISYGVISLGAEARWGTGKYKDLVGKLVDKENVELDELFGGDSQSKIKTSGVRVYISFRF